jgi:hypothetical protein
LIAIRLRFCARNKRLKNTVVHPNRFAGSLRLESFILISELSNRCRNNEWNNLANRFLFSLEKNPKISYFLADLQFFRYF